MNSRYNRAAEVAMKTNDLDRRVGERLRSRRLKMGLSQTELGAAAGVTFQQVQKYEKGANRISASRMIQFAERLGAAQLTLSRVSAADQKPTAMPARRPAPLNRSQPAMRV
jgi:transcriptional regulator with XRE-family HTH domain